MDAEFNGQPAGGEDLNRLLEDLCETTNPVS